MFLSSRVVPPTPPSLVKLSASALALMIGSRTSVPSSDQVPELKNATEGYAEAKSSLATLDGYIEQMNAVLAHPDLPVARHSPASRFITLFYGLYSPATGDLQYVNAGALRSGFA